VLCVPHDSVVFTNRQFDWYTRVTLHTVNYVRLSEVCRSAKFSPQERERERERDPPAADDATQEALHSTTASST